jgi:seryl-tRNA synthetase
VLDIKLFRESPEIIKKNLEKRGWTKKNIDLVDEVVEYDKKWREARVKGDGLKHERNTVTKEISDMKNEGKDITSKVAAMKDINKNIRELDDEIESSLKNRDKLLLRIPNLMHVSVPVGKDDSENMFLRSWGEPKKYEFELKSHQDIIEGLGQGSFEFSQKPAVMRFAIDYLRNTGFKLVEPPFMLRRKAMQGMVDLSDFEDVLYKMENEDLYLISTSEHPMGAMLMDKVLSEKDLPLRFCGVSPCFRKEIGAHGVDTRGIFRTHQFNKVEQFIFSTPEQSWEMHDLLIKNAEALYQKLEIPYRIMNICTGDLGGTAAKKYDLEAWMAKQGAYKEVVSCSNCTSYQARKLNVRYEKTQGEREFLHTINSTAIATSRTIVAILENNQQDDTTVVVPKVWMPYINGIRALSKQRMASLYLLSSINATPLLCHAQG